MYVAVFVELGDSKDFLYFPDAAKDLAVGQVVRQLEPPLLALDVEDEPQGRCSIAKG